MSDVQVRLMPERDPDDAKDAILAILDGEVEKFSQYMALLDSPARGALSHPERALLKTYLVAKLREKI